MRKLLLAGAVALVATAAHASPISGLGTWSVISADTPSNTASSPAQQGLPGAAAAIALGSNVQNYGGAYNGALNFNDPTGGSNTIGGFLATDNPTGTFGGCTGSCSNEMLSASGFAHVSLFNFTFTAPYVETVTFAFDDGISLFVKGDTTNDLLPIGESAPTASGNASIQLAAGDYSLYYSEANGLPAHLLTSVPEPTSVTLLGASLIGLGMICRRRVV